MLWVDAALSYLHFTAVFVLFAFLSVELMMLKLVLDAHNVRLLARVDLWYLGAAMVTLVTGFLRLGMGAKGAAFYTTSWTLYAKIGLFLLVAAMSIHPTLAFMRWRRGYDAQGAYQVPAAEQARMRRFVLMQLHVAALIPVFAVMMARGLGR